MNPVSPGVYFALKVLIHELKQEREAAGLTLAAHSKRTGMDQTAISPSEHGRQPNPTVATLWRYARVVGGRLVLTHAEGDTRQQRTLSPVTSVPPGYAPGSARGGGACVPPARGRSARNSDFRAGRRASRPGRCRTTSRSVEHAIGNPFAHDRIDARCSSWTSTLSCESWSHGPRRGSSGPSWSSRTTGGGGVVQPAGEVRHGGHRLARQRRLHRAALRVAAHQSGGAPSARGPSTRSRWPSERSPVEPVTVAGGTRLPTLRMTNSSPGSTDAQHVR